MLFPGAVTWKGIVAETGGSWWAILGTALLAALPEEFFRFAWQTRVGAWLKRRLPPNQAPASFVIFSTMSRISRRGDVELL